MPATSLMSLALRILRYLLIVEGGENWLKRAHVEKFLGLKHIDSLVTGLDKCEMPTRNDIQPTVNQPWPWPGPKDYQNKTDKFFSAFGVIYVIVNSPKDKDKTLKEHVLKDIVPRGFNARINKIQEEHQRAIEEKDAARALLNDDLQNREYENVALQAQRDAYQAELQKCQDTITHLKTRYVPHARDPDKDNIIIVQKHTTSTNDKYYDLPYYVSRIQRRKRHVKLRWLIDIFLTMKLLWR